MYWPRFVFLVVSSCAIESIFGQHIIIIVIEFLSLSLSLSSYSTIKYLQKAALRSEMSETNDMMHSATTSRDLWERRCVENNLDY